MKKATHKFKLTLRLSVVLNGQLIGSRTINDAPSILLELVAYINFTVEAISAYLVAQLSTLLKRDTVGHLEVYISHGTHKNCIFDVHGLIPAERTEIRNWIEKQYADIRRKIILIFFEAMLDEVTQNGLDN